MGLYVLLLVITVFVPVAELVTLFMLPVPFIVYASRHGWRPSIVVFFVAMILSSLFATVLSIPITVMMGLGGILIGSAIKQKLTPYETWARGTIGFVIGIVFSFIFAQVIFDVNFVEEMESVLDQSRQTTENIIDQFGLEVGSEELDAIYQQMDQITNLLPVGMVFMAILIGFLSQWLGYKVLNRITQTKLQFPPFREFRLPIAIVWFYFLSLLLTWFNLDADSTLYLGAINISTLAGLLVMLQGFSFIFYYTYMKNLSKAVPIISIVIAVLFPFLGLYLIRILGIIDLGFSLRDRVKSKRNGSD